MKERSKKVKGKSEEGRFFPFSFFLLPSAVSRRLSPTGNKGDAIFHLAILATSVIVVLIVIAMIVALASHATLSIRQFGFSFLTSREWDPIKGHFGSLAFIYGDRKSTRLNSSHVRISYAVFCLKKKKTTLVNRSSMISYESCTVAGGTV